MEKSRNDNEVGNDRASDKRVLTGMFRDQESTERAMWSFRLRPRMKKMPYTWKTTGGKTVVKKSTINIS